MSEPVDSLLVHCALAKIITIAISSGSDTFTT